MDKVGYLEFLKSKEKEFVGLVNSQKLPLKTKIQVLGIISGLFRGLRTIDSIEKLKRIEEDMNKLLDLLENYTEEKLDGIINAFLEDFNLFSINSQDTEIYRSYIMENKSVLVAGLEDSQMRNILIVIVKETILPFIIEAEKYGNPEWQFNSCFGKKR